MAEGDTNVAEGNAARVYALANQKGGVGKTTTAVSLAAFLGGAGVRVLLVDMDPQASASSSLNIDKDSVPASVYDVLMGRRTLRSVVLRNARLHIDVAPASPALANAEVELVSEIGREHRLRTALEEALALYDYILIDCPPSLGLLTVNALTAARDGAIVPIQCEYLALQGLGHLLRAINLVRAHLNPETKVRGLLMTMFDPRTNLSQEVVDEVRAHFPDLVFGTVIPRNVRLSEAPSHGEPILTYAPNSAGAVAYAAFAEELLRGDDRMLSAGRVPRAHSAAAPAGSAES
ncbi:MAG: AAA family ATPase [Anaerolineae bacterium]|nr:AAA family ATPase [Anaerolineae bacterium]